MTRTIAGAAQLAGKKVAVVGLGKSGRGCLAALGELTEAVVGAWDSRREALEEVDGAGLAALDHCEDPRELARRIDAWNPDIVIPAPGIAETGPLFATSQRAGRPVWSEIELAWRLRAFDDGASAPWLCVTGTNGKTTTVGMTEAILRAAGLRAQAIGNVGTPAVTTTSRMDDAAPQALAVELSSFQLRSTHSMSPLASACLNIADDHLEWHGSRQAYWQAKARIFERVQAACVYPVGDASVQRMVDGADVVEGARAIGVTMSVPAVGQIGLVGGLVVDRAYGEGRFSQGIELFELDDLEHLAPGGGELPAHIVWDAVTAAALARAAEVPAEAVRQAMRDFTGGGHRIELVATSQGVNYVDDSKATNAHAARASLAAHADGSVVWIVGGLAKGASFDDLVASVVGKVRGVVVIGVDQEPWRRALEPHDLPVAYIDPNSSAIMDEAVERARSMARNGDTVLLAPACASMDQFASYAERGEAFGRAVRSLNG
ncbi:MAG: UDP-N-acetylmuramoyl-L-alanine--D-glutamate ligase [Actinomycetaceae bacterium]|nr:UDP-N-acetylmuramoyl-L-alanine--D-glutamate ligase [Actinomycetaceae bacterium]